MSSDKVRTTKVYYPQDWVRGLRDIGRAVGLSPRVLGDIFREAKLPPYKLYAQWHIPRSQIHFIVHWIYWRKRQGRDAYLSRWIDNQRRKVLPKTEDEDEDGSVSNLKTTMD
jgi:hypothetical protein